jgi:hypothetical protein
MKKHLAGQASTESALEYGVVMIGVLIAIFAVLLGRLAWQPFLSFPQTRIIAGLAVDCEAAAAKRASECLEGFKGVSWVSTWLLMWADAKIVANCRAGGSVQ